MVCAIRSADGGMRRSRSLRMKFRKLRFCGIALALLSYAIPATAFSDRDNGDRYADSYDHRDKRADRLKERDRRYSRDRRDDEEFARWEAYRGDDGANPEHTPFDDYLRRQAARERRSDYLNEKRVNMEVRAKENERDRRHDERAPFSHDKVDFGDPGF